MTTYYVDTASSGGDGTTQALSGANAAFATIAAMQAKVGGYAAGDSILLKKSCIWRESLTFPSSGNVGGQIVIGTYGTGEGPIIYGSNNFGGYAAAGGTNILSNSSFENFTGTPDDETVDSFTGWAINTRVYAVSSNSPPLGTYCVRLWKDASTTATMRQTGITLAPGKTYALWCKEISDGTGKVTFMLRQESGAQSYLQTNGTWAAGSVYNELGNNSHNVWSTTTIRYITTPSDYNGTYWFSLNNIVVNSSTYVDDLHLELYEWQNVSGDEYKIICTNSVGNPLGTFLPWWLNGTSWVRFVSGTAGSLNAGEFNYTFPFLSVNLGTGLNPSGKQLEVPMRDYPVTINGKSYVTMQNLAAKFGLQNGFSLSGTGSNNYLSYCTAFGNANDGINGHNAQTDVLLDYCTSQYNGVGRGLGGAPGDGISFHETCTGTIQNCIITDNDKAGIDNIDDTAFTVKQNYLEHNDYNLYMGASATAKNNWYCNVIKVSTDDTYGIALGDNCTCDMDIYNNTVIGATAGTAAYMGAGAKTVNLKNNILQGCATGIHKGATITLNADNNCVYDNAAQYDGLSAGANDVPDDPKFVSISDFHLQSTSPCINAGVDVSLTEDYEGRSIVGLPDIGAYETPPYQVIFRRRRKHRP